MTFHSHTLSFSIFTGVGKTELAKALAYLLFDDEKHLVRIDMSEYMEKHSVSRLIGAPPGYIGHEEGGSLTEAVRRRPYNVVLFDEVEKAAPEVLNVLLQVLDDGRLTDGQGRTVDFSNTVVIMTSNIGAEYLLQAYDAEGRLDPRAKQLVMEAVRQNFRPELLNRMDDIVVFEPLTRENLHKVVELQLLNVSARLVERDILVSLTPEATDFVVHSAYQPQYGARPLRRYLEKNVVTNIGKLMLRGEVFEHCTVTVGVANGELSFSVAPLSPNGAKRPRM